MNENFPDIDLSKLNIKTVGYKTELYNYLPANLKTEVNNWHFRGIEPKKGSNKYFQ